MKNKYIQFVLLGFILLLTSCSVDPTYYSQVVPSNFYQSQDNVWQRFYRPFTHWRWYIGTDEGYWRCEELGTDEFCLPTRGSDWYNGGQYQLFHHHKYYDQMDAIGNGWSGFGMGVALAWDTYRDLSTVDFDKLGFASGTRESMLAQLNALVASFYKDGLDLFGGVPLYGPQDLDIKGRYTAQETFNFIDSLLNVAIPQLPVKEELGGAENGTINRAAGAALKAELYFNAISYIDKDMFSETATICQDIIDGKYGPYDLDDDWTTTFGFNNETSKEIIWSIPSQNAKLQSDGDYWGTMMPYNYYKYLGNLQNSSAKNGYCLLPSRDPSGELYTYHLGEPYEKFADGDVRKQNYVYEGNGKYRGMFVIGRLVNPLDTTFQCLGAREYSGKVITIRDQVSYFAQLGSSKYLDVASLPSTIATAEENSGVRLIKRSPRPTQDDASLMYNPDIPVIRLSEIYYMLAECKMRAGDKAGAAALINKVRKRYFVNGQDPDPVTAANLDKYRMLDEWLEEFLGEGRRRTDLRRWNAYVTEDWWDHKATNDANINLFPVPASAINANNKLEQNPGY